MEESIHNDDGDVAQQSIWLWQRKYPDTPRIDLPIRMYNGSHLIYNYIMYLGEIMLSCLEEVSVETSCQ